MSTETYEGWDRPALMNEAREKFGVKFDTKMKRDEMIQKLGELQEAEDYLVKEAAGEIKDEEEAPQGMRKVRIKIHKSDGPDGNNDVKVGLNGRAYQIKRDSQVDIPEPVFNACIKGAVFTVYEPVTNPVTGQIEITERDVDRFAYTLYGYADQLGELEEPSESRASMMKHNLR